MERITKDRVKKMHFTEGEKKKSCVARMLAVPIVEDLE